MSDRCPLQELIENKSGTPRSSNTAASKKNYIDKENAPVTEALPNENEKSRNSDMPAMIPTNVDTVYIDDDSSDDVHILNRSSPTTMILSSNDTSPEKCASDISESPFLKNSLLERKSPNSSFFASTSSNDDELNSMREQTPPLRVILKPTPTVALISPMPNMSTPIEAVPRARKSFGNARPSCKRRLSPILKPESAKTAKTDTPIRTIEEKRAQNYRPSLLKSFDPLYEGTPRRREEPQVNEHSKQNEEADDGTISPRLITLADWLRKEPIDESLPLPSAPKPGPSKNKQNISKKQAPSVPKRNTDVEKKALDKKTSKPTHPIEPPQNLSNLDDKASGLTQNTEKTLRADTEKTLRADTEKTLRADTEKTFRADTEKTFRADTEKTFRADTEKTFRADTEKTLGADTEKTLRADTENKKKAVNLETASDESTHEDSSELLSISVGPRTEKTESEQTTTTPETESVQTSSEVILVDSQSTDCNSLDTEGGLLAIQSLLNEHAANQNLPPVNNVVTVENPCIDLDTGVEKSNDLPLNEQNIKTIANKEKVLIESPEVIAEPNNTQIKKLKDIVIHSCISLNIQRADIENLITEAGRVNTATASDDNFSGLCNVTKILDSNTNIELNNQCANSNLSDTFNCDETISANPTILGSEQVNLHRESINNLERERKETHSVEELNTCISVAEQLPTVSQEEFKKMSEHTNNLEEQNCNLKLLLNQQQQARASLELQLRQKEEIYIKAQAEFQKKEANYKTEIKTLTEKIEALNHKKDGGEEVQELKEQIAKLKAHEEKLLSQVSSKSIEETTYKQVMDEYQKVMNQHVCELEKLNQEHDTAKRHLATLEMAFADIHQKYERSKTIITGYKNNEDTLSQTLALMEEEVRKHGEKYESLKAHAMAQIDKSNRELSQARDKHQIEVNKLTAIIRRLEIKIASLNVALEQKTKECAQIAALCDEVTGKVE